MNVPIALILAAVLLPAFAAEPATVPASQSAASSTTAPTTAPADFIAVTKAHPARVAEAARGILKQKFGDVTEEKRSNVRTFSAKRRTVGLNS